MKLKFRMWSLLTCIMLASSILFTSIPTYASTVSDARTNEADADAVKIFDIVLGRMGVIPNEATLLAVYEKYQTTVENAISDIMGDMIADGLTTPADFLTYVNNSDYDSGLKKIITRLWNLGYITDLVVPTLNRYNFGEALLGDDGGTVKRGNTYTIDDDIVNDVNNTFQVWWSDNGGYILVETIGVKDRLTNASYFDKSTEYSNACAMYENLVDGDIYYGGWSGRSAVNVIPISGYNMVLGSDGIVNNTDNSYIYFSLYTDNWTSVTLYYYATYFSSGTSITCGNRLKCGSRFPNYVTVGNVDNLYGNYLFSKNGGEKVKIWRTLDGFKKYSVGKQDVYYTTTYTNTSYNTVSYTGDYYCDNSTTYNYSIVQENINNSTEISDSIVNSIVDESVTNITNNYYYTSGSDDTTTDGDTSTDDNTSTDGDTSTDSDNPFDGVFEKLMDAVGNIVGLLDDVVALVLSFVADALNAIVSMVTNVVNMLTAFKEELSGLSGALGEFFPYLPEDFWTLIMGTISVICGLAVIKFFKK